MSNILVGRVVENIRAKTTAYTPVVETIVNAIQAIVSKQPTDGRINIRVLRDSQHELDNEMPTVVGFEIEDNGVGFDSTNRDSFDTLYSDLKITEGGKGFGRFVCLKYFENVNIRSCFCEDGTYRIRRFSMGKENDIIINEQIEDSPEEMTGSIVTLLEAKNRNSFDKRLGTIARQLVERLLPYFIADDFSCPTITLSESDGSSEQFLNDYVGSEAKDDISEIKLRKNSFALNANNEQKEFVVRVFKLLFPKQQKSRISLVAHKREVSGSPIHRYIPEFIDEFYELDDSGNSIQGSNYIIKAYVFGDYLDENVSLERGGFEFQMENDVLYGISQKEIEKQASEFAKLAAGTSVRSRQEKKRERIENYVRENAPWHRHLAHKMDLETISYNPTDEEIEGRLQKVKFIEEMKIKRDVDQLLSQSSLADVGESVLETVKRISDTSKNDLIHYIALRRNILEIFDKSLQIDSSGRYNSEGMVHDIIFPRRGDTNTIAFDKHNLWLIDERLNFSHYVSSDIPLADQTSNRPDLLVYDHRVQFRGDNEPSNPVTVFEFKRPQRDDFADPSSTDDPIKQIIRYVNDIRDGKHKTPEGRKMLVEDNTPFYGYVVCDLTLKVENWLDREKNFKRMPDGLGWFQWKENINLYIEVLSWDKLLKDSNMRNRIFFEKLNI